MWKCQYCDKTNLDDKAICPYCNAPNPAVQKPNPANAPQSPIYPQSANKTQPAQDWESRYNPKQSSKPKLRSILTYTIIGVAAILLIVVLTLIIQKPVERGLSAAAAQKTEAVLQDSKDGVIASAEKETPAPTATPEPTRAPVVVDAATELYLDFGQSYQCSTSDFVLPSDIPEDEITWHCADNDAGTTCTKDGLIVAGDCQVDPEKVYNDEVIITGSTPEGSVLYYHVYSGNGQTYSFGWSTSARAMRGALSGYTIVSDEMLVQCNGFSVYYEYELTKGKMEANAWSVWVRENGTTWVRVQDIHLENKVGDVFDITFDHPITFNEIWIMPETYSQNYSVTTEFQVGYLLF